MTEPPRFHVYLAMNGHAVLSFMLAARVRLSNVLFTASSLGHVPCRRRRRSKRPVETADITAPEPAGH